MKNKLLFTLAILFLLTNLDKIYAQKGNGFAVEGGLIASDSKLNPNLL